MILANAINLRYLARLIPFSNKMYRQMINIYWSYASFYQNTSMQPTGRFSQPLDTMVNPTINDSLTLYFIKKKCVSCRYRLLENRIFILVVRNVGISVISISRSDFRSSPDIVSNKVLSSNVTGRKYDVTKAKPSEVYCKLQNCIYFAKYSIQYLIESITPLSKKMNWKRLRGKRSAIQNYSAQWRCGFR